MTETNRLLVILRDLDATQGTGVITPGFYEISK